IGVKRLVERALWAQGVRTVLERGKKRHEFQTDHGFRKWYNKTRNGWNEVNKHRVLNFLSISMGYTLLLGSVT
ncbi:MAG: hypothetical protein WB443_10830, partial [Nitrososphaeraceae archaeon]